MSDTQLKVQIVKEAAEALSKVRTSGYCAGEAIKKTVETLTKPTGSR